MMEFERELYRKAKDAITEMSKTQAEKTGTVVLEIIAENESALVAVYDMEPSAAMRAIYTNMRDALPRKRDVWAVVESAVNRVELERSYREAMPYQMDYSVAKKMAEVGAEAFIAELVERGYDRIKGDFYSQCRDIAYRNLQR